MSPDQIRFKTFVEDREYLRKYPGRSVPIISKYHFCNINREDDRVTQWIRRSMRSLIETLEPSLEWIVRMLLVYRIFNQPSTLAKVESITDASTILEILTDDTSKLFRGAYMMVPHGVENTGVRTLDYYCGTIAQAETINLHGATALAHVAHALMQLQGVSDFLANQICADLRYTVGVDSWVDWETFILLGQGTRRGLSRLDPKKPMGGIKVPPPDRYKPKHLLALRNELIGNFDHYVKTAFRDPNNFSNALCEFDKYERARNQILEGKVVTLRHYTPHGNQEPKH